MAWRILLKLFLNYLSPKGLVGFNGQCYGDDYVLRASRRLCRLQLYNRSLCILSVARWVQGLFIVATFFVIMCYSCAFGCLAHTDEQLPGLDVSPGPLRK